MRSFAVAVALGLVLGATTPLLAQTGQPAGVGQAPAAPAAPAQPAAQPPRPVPEGAKVAVVNIQRVAQESTEGKAATAKVQALHQQKTQQLNDLNKKLQADQQRLQQQQSVMNEQARGQLDAAPVQPIRIIQAQIENGLEITHYPGFAPAFRFGRGFCEVDRN